MSDELIQKVVASEATCIDGQTQGLPRTSTLQKIQATEPLYNQIPQTFKTPSSSSLVVAAIAGMQGVNQPQSIGARGKNEQKSFEVSEDVQKILDNNQSFFADLIEDIKRGRVITGGIAYNANNLTDKEMERVLKEAILEKTLELVPSGVYGTELDPYTGRPMAHMQSFDHIQYQLMLRDAQKKDIEEKLGIDVNKYAAERD